NVISGNDGDGVLLKDPQSTGNVVEGNLIGTNAAGMAALPNGGHGVGVAARASGHTIGGGGPGGPEILFPRGHLFSPEGIAVAADGDLIVTDNGTATLLRINPRTGIQTAISSGFDTPDGVALAANGDVYVSDFGAKDIIRVDRTTGAQSILSSGGAFANPYAIAVAANGDLFVTDFNAFSGARAVFECNHATVGE